MVTPEPAVLSEATLRAALDNFSKWLEKPLVFPEQPVVISVEIHKKLQKMTFEERCRALHILRNLQ